MAKLDQLDRKILANLDRSARQSTSEIARTVRHGRDIVAYRLERLYAEEVILRARAILNPYALGLTIYKTYLKLRNNPAGIQKLMRKLLSSENVYCYAECDGNWDLIFNMVASTPFLFDDYQDSLLSEYTDLILAREVAIVLRQETYPRKNLVDYSVTPWSIGGQLFDQEIDIADQEILKLLTLDARMSLTEMAERLSITPIMVRSRIRKLEQAQIILGYRLDLNRSQLGLSAFKCQIEFLPQISPRFKELEKYCHKSTGVTSFIRQLGSCRLECNLEAPHHEATHGIIDELRAKFSDFIDSATLIFVREERFVWSVATKKRGKKSEALLGVGVV